MVRFGVKLESGQYCKSIVIYHRYIKFDMINKAMISDTAKVMILCPKKENNSGWELSLEDLHRSEDGNKTCPLQ